MAVQGPSDRPSEEAEPVVFSGDLKGFISFCVFSQVLTWFRYVQIVPMAEVMEFSYIHPPPQARLRNRDKVTGID